MPFLGFIAAIVLAVLGLLGGYKAYGVGQTSTGTLSASSVVVDQAANGHTVSAPRGVPVEIHLSHRWTWGTPRADHQAGVQRIDYVTDPGYDAWLVQPRGKGTVTVRATGRPGPRTFTLKIRVR